MRFARPRDVAIFPDGARLTHAWAARLGDPYQECSTPFGELRCRCGAYLIVWEDQDERGKVRAGLAEDLTC